MPSTAARLRRYVSTLPTTYRITSAAISRALDIPRPTAITYLRRLESQGVVALVSQFRQRPLAFRRSPQPPSEMSS